VTLKLLTTGHGTKFKSTAPSHGSIPMVIPFTWTCLPVHRYEGKEPVICQQLTHRRRYLRIWAHQGQKPVSTQNSPRNCVGHPVNFNVFANFLSNCSKFSGKVKNLSTSTGLDKLGWTGVPAFAITFRSSNLMI